jgi:hypothetical protein
VQELESLLGRDVPCPLCNQSVMIIATGLHPQTGRAFGAMLDHHWIPTWPLAVATLEQINAWSKIEARCPMSGAEVRARK